MLIITYDIYDKENDEMQVILRTPVDLKFLIEMTGEGVSGDIGFNIRSGKNKQVIILKEKLPNIVVQGRFVPYILAFDGTGYGNEMVEVKRESGVTFLYDKFEITNEQYLAFIEAGGYEYQEFWTVDDGSITCPELGWFYRELFKWENPRFWNTKEIPYWKSDPYSNSPISPVVGISWWEVYAYTKWAEKTLPFNEDWETAYGKRKDERRFPWGNGLLLNQSPPEYWLCNCKIGYKNKKYRKFTKDGYEYTAPTGYYSPYGDSPFGVSDLTGNVSEWLNNAMAYVEYGAHICAERLIKGGSFKTEITDLENEFRVFCPLYRMEDIGFRCALY